jgi:lysophospholipase L1-like esterase
MKSKIISKCLLALCLLNFVCALSFAQPFREEIARFKQQDSIHFPPANANLFIGSSSFTKWTDVQDYFPGYKIINRGFGGSTLLDVIRYVPEIVYPYRPLQVVIYCGENDLAADSNVTGITVAKRFIRLFKLIRKKYPDIPIAYVSMKPSPSRINLMPKMERGNNLIKNFLSTKQYTKFIDVYHLMLTNEGKPIGSIFLEDSLHMNASGYHIWQKAIKPVLVKEPKKIM